VKASQLVQERFLANPLNSLFADHSTAPFDANQAQALTAV